MEDKMELIIGLLKTHGEHFGEKMDFLDYKGRMIKLDLELVGYKLNQQFLNGKIDFLI